MKREVKEELGISVVLADLEPYYIWATGENEGQHLAICFQYKIETEGLKLYMDEHELVQSKGQSISGKFMTIQEILNQKNELEPWSVVILKHQFNVNVELSQQLSLFECWENMQ